ncbi:hypothetical protein NKH52_15690 [Mesorhizobium sp. M1066]|uniref:hypothetical protein n=1 Tax=unclassified Mesorhizobium TaxID=325217 RepID=UPI00333AC631
MASAVDNQVSVIAEGAALGKHLATHKAARGQEFWQSGNGCFWSEGHGIPSDMDAISAIVAVESTTIVIAADGNTIGAVRMLTTARIESRRGNTVQNFTQPQWHMVRCKRRPTRSHFRQVIRHTMRALPGVKQSLQMVMCRE